MTTETHATATPPPLDHPEWRELVARRDQLHSRASQLADELREAVAHGDKIHPGEVRELADKLLAGESEAAPRPAPDVRQIRFNLKATTAALAKANSQVEELRREISRKVEAEARPQFRELVVARYEALARYVDATDAVQQFVARLESRGFLGGELSDPVRPYFHPALGADRFTLRQFRDQLTARHPGLFSDPAPGADDVAADAPPAPAEDHAR